MSTVKEENVDIKYEKTKLFFDKKNKTYIEFDYDQKITCQKIYDENKDKIIETIKKLYQNLPNEFDLDTELEDDNYYFCLCQEKKIKDNNKLSSTIDLKLSLSHKIYNILYNKTSTAFLCFLPKNKTKTNLRKNAISLFVLEKDIYEDTQDSKLRDNTDKNNISNEIFKGTIYILDPETKNHNFVKKEVVVDLEKITFTKENKVIYSHSIRNYTPFLYESDEYKKYKIKGDKNYLYLMIETSTQNEPLFFSHKKDYFKKFIYAIKCCVNNYKMSLSDLKIDNDIYSTKSGLFAIYHLIIENCFLIKEILSNEEKRKIFIEVFPDRVIGSMIEQILEYKLLNKKEQYLESWTFFKQILSSIQQAENKKNEEKKSKINDKNVKIGELDNILKKVNISKYKEVLKETNEALQKTFSESKNKNNTDINNNFQNNLNKALKEYLKENLFDELFYYLYNLHIYPFFEETNKTLKKGESPENKSELRKKFQLLLALYYFKFFELKFNYLGEKGDSKNTSSLSK